MTKEKAIRTLSNRDIKKLADTLPILKARTTKEKHWVKGSELIAQGHTHDIKTGVPFIPGLTYEQEMPVIIAVNHYKQMRSIHLKLGDEGVQAYMVEVLKHSLTQDLLQDERKTTTPQVKRT